METRVLCSASCIHNTDSGYYSLCKNPQLNIIYAGFARVYLEGCRYRVREEDRSSEVVNEEVLQAMCVG